MLKNWDKMDLNELRSTAALCRLCDLHAGRIKPVFDKGNPQAKLMICGMVPAHEENNVGTPFVGRAGKLLDDILSDSNLTSDDVYITNLVKCCLSPGKPLQEEWVAHCLPYIIVQIDLLKPKAILALGADASINLLGLDPKPKMWTIRGKVFSYSNDTLLIPTYHPSYLLRGGGKKHAKYDSVIDDVLLAVESSERN